MTVETFNAKQTKFLNQSFKVSQLDNGLSWKRRDSENSDQGTINFILECLFQSFLNGVFHDTSVSVMIQ